MFSFLFIISLFTIIALCMVIYKLLNKQKELKDILEQQKQKDEDKNTKQSKLASFGEMMDAIAHQWKQPLNSINLSIQKLDLKIIYEEEITNEEIEETSNLIQTQIDHLVSTIDEFRQFFRPNQLQSKVSVKALIESTIELMKNQFISHNIEVKIDCQEDIQILCMPNEFKHVFINLINNAKDAFEEQKGDNNKIIFRLFKDGEKSIIQIHDNAGGIQKDIIDNIFTSNFTTKSHNAGTGIGLYLVNQIINKVNATIKVENIKKGACFTIEF